MTFDFFGQILFVTYCSVKLSLTEKRSLLLFKPRHRQFSILCHPSSYYVAWNSAALFFSEDVPFNVTGMLKKHVNMLFVSRLAERAVAAVLPQIAWQI